MHIHVRYSSAILKFLPVFWLELYFFPFFLIKFNGIGFLRNGTVKKSTQLVSRYIEGQTNPLLLPMLSLCSQYRRVVSPNQTALLISKVRVFVFQTDLVTLDVFGLTPRWIHTIVTICLFRNERVIDRPVLSIHAFC